MSYDSHRPLSSYSILEVLSRSIHTIIYYSFYTGAFLFWFLPRSWLFLKESLQTPNEQFEPYADHYYTRPEFAFFKAEEGRCFRDNIASLLSPSLEIGYEDGRISSYHTGGHVFDIGMEYDPSVIGKPPLFPNYHRIVTGSFNQMPFADASIGSIVAIHILDHVAHLDAALAETARVLRPGGQFHFSLFSPQAPIVVGLRSIKVHGLHNFLDQTDWREKLIRHGLKVEVYREFTFSRLYLRLYFLGMDGLIPHDRSFLFSRLEKHAPVPARWVKIFLKRVTYEFYWREFNRPKIGFGCNVFIAARKVTLPAIGL